MIYHVVTSCRTIQVDTGLYVHVGNLLFQLNMTHHVSHMLTSSCSWTHVDINLMYQDGTGCNPTHVDTGPYTALYQPVFINMLTRYCKYLAV